MKIKRELKNIWKIFLNPLVARAQFFRIQRRAPKESPKATLRGKIFVEKSSDFIQKTQHSWTYGN